MFFFPLVASLSNQCGCDFSIVSFAGLSPSSLGISITNFKITAGFNGIRDHANRERGYRAHV